MRGMLRPPCRVPRGLLAAALAAGALALLAGCAGEPPRHSVLVVSVDSLRVDRLALWNPETGVVTPHLEALADRGSLYVNAWATAPWTAPSMVSLLTGLHPPTHGIFARDDTTPPGLPTLPELLAERGYRRGNFSFFSTISYFRNLGLGEPQQGLGHTRIAEAFGSWLAEGEPGEPFFAWLHLLEPHLPYGATGYQATEVQVPGSSGLEEAQLRAAVPVGTVEFEEGDRDKLLALYDQDLAAMDETLGRVLDALAEQGREESTLVVFVADHGEELLEAGWIGHASTAKQAKMIPEVLRVPLVLAGPGVPAGEVHGDLVQPVDVLPTLGRLLDLPLLETLDGIPLPGFGPSWWPFGQDRRWAFFDSSAGGNLTPREQREERIQGVTDGKCLLTEHLTPGRPDQVALSTAPPYDATCDDAERSRLTEALDAWRSRQATQRLAVLSGSGDRPDAPEDADGFAEAIEVRSPLDGEALLWRSHRGQLVLQWEGEGASYWVEYEAGAGARAVSGVFTVETPRIRFGPFPKGFWNDLAGYGPFRFRVLDADREERSPWVEFEVLAVE